MKKEQERELLSGMAQVVALLNLYEYLLSDKAQKTLKSKSPRKEEKTSQEMVFAQYGHSTILNIINLLAPFLVSLGVNIGYDEEDNEYFLLYKDNVVELTEEGTDKFLERILKRTEEA